MLDTHYGCFTGFVFSVCVVSGLLIIAVVGIATVVSVTIVTIGVACLCRSVH